MTHEPAVAAPIGSTLRQRISAVLPPLHGWTSVDKGVRLAELVMLARARLSVELGVFGGRGTIALAIGHQALGRGSVCAIDPWDVAASLEGANAAENDRWWGNLDHEAIYQGFLAALEATGTARWCRVMRMRSSEAIAAFDEGTIDVLHQDSNHSELVSCDEVERWTPKMAPGGYWVADDTDWPTTAKAQRLLEAKGFELVEDRGSWRVYRKPWPGSPPLSST